MPYYKHTAKWNNWENSTKQLLLINSTWQHCTSQRSYSFSKVCAIFCKKCTGAGKQSKSKSLHTFVSKVGKMSHVSPGRGVVGHNFDWCTSKISYWGAHILVFQTYHFDTAYMPCMHASNVADDPRSHYFSQNYKCTFFFSNYHGFTAYWYCLQTSFVWPFTSMHAIDSCISSVHT